MQVQFLGWEDLLEEDMATHCRILAWRIPWTEKPVAMGYCPWVHKESVTEVTQHTYNTKQVMPF